MISQQLTGNHLWHSTCNVFCGIENAQKSVTLMSSIAKMLEFIFGCHHSNLSRVFTLGRHSYRVCCECGARFEYSLDTMSIQKRDYPQLVPARCFGADLKNAHSNR